MNFSWSPGKELLTLAAEVSGCRAHAAGGGNVAHGIRLTGGCRRGISADLISLGDQSGGAMANEFEVPSQYAPTESTGGRKPERACVNAASRRRRPPRHARHRPPGPPQPRRSVRVRSFSCIGRESPCRPRPARRSAPMAAPAGRPSPPVPFRSAPAGRPSRAGRNKPEHGGSLWRTAERAKPGLPSRRPAPHGHLLAVAVGYRAHPRTVTRVTSPQWLR